jgi:hypothetical protein
MGLLIGEHSRLFVDQDGSRRTLTQPYKEQHMARAPLRAGMLGVGTIATASYGFLPGIREMQEEVNYPRLKHLGLSLARQPKLPPRQ